MQDSLDVFELIDFLRAHWKFVGLACAFAVVAGLAAGLMLPKRYTATATILIDPPAGGDPRIATAVSNVYLESLKTYELVASNDELFERAARQFHLDDQDGWPIESLKRRVLKVDKLRDTRALQISVTLPDPRTAQGVAQYIAEGAVELSRSGPKQAEASLLDIAAKTAEAADVRLNDAAARWQQTAGANSAETLRSEVSDDSFLKSHVEEQLLDEQAGLAGSNSTAQRDAVVSHARVELLQRRIGELTRSIDAKSALLAQQSAREQNLEAVLAAARTASETATQRLADLRMNLASRSEWLRLVDPSIIPQRPSSPNLPLILIGAVSLAFFGSLLYLTLSFSLTRGRPHYIAPLCVASHAGD
jgi:polysaccharide biosynthesis transport protein